MVKEKGEGENTLCLSWPFGFAVMNPSVSRKSLILSTSSSWQITVRSLNPSALFLLPFFCNIIKTGLKLGKFLVLQECRRDPLQRVVFTEETTAPSLLYLLCHCLFKPAMRKTQAQAIIICICWDTKNTDTDHTLVTGSTQLTEWTRRGYGHSYYEYECKLKENSLMVCPMCKSWKIQMYSIFFPFL